MALALGHGSQGSQCLGTVRFIPELADEIFGFHAQQAAEKALKAWISKLGGTYPPTHDLSKLIPILARLGIEVEALWPLTGWNSFAVQYRYDALPEDAPALPRHEIIQTLHALFRSVDS